jgi:hypothetical protein
VGQGGGQRVRRRPVPSPFVRWKAAAAGVMLLGAAACSSTSRIEVSEGSQTITSAVDVTTTTARPSATTPPPTPPTPDRPHLGWLAIDDRPTPTVPYRRDDWPTWLDPDGNGCDARDDVLRASSLTPVTAAGCDVAFGQWTSIYDARSFTAASELDIDHVVALEQAHRSGGWQWTAQQRAVFANDPVNLVAVSASSNRSKGSSTPDEWRPPAVESWCEMASVYVTVKATYRLTVTTSERDALGQMLDTCPS